MGTPIRYFQVDAFTSELFKGNPAGVCVLEGNEWLADDLMQRIAAENKLSETAFVRCNRNGTFDLRWFTPTVEVDLCGHATLASAFVLFNECKLVNEQVRFCSKSGVLLVNRKRHLLELDFPSRPANRETRVDRTLKNAVGAWPEDSLRVGYHFMLVFENEDIISALRPQFNVISALPGGCMIATAPGKQVDFVSRFFAPGLGIDEDPVTGSTHCTLIPYWAERLGKTKLKARQLSARGGELFCELRGDRVGIGGQAVLYSSGHLHV